MEVSLKNLGLDYIDSWVLHSPLRSMEQTLQAWLAMEKHVVKNKTKQLGISNCYDPKVFKHLYDKSSIKPKVLQNRFYSNSGYDIELRKFCSENNISYQSFWTLTANPHILNHQKTVSKAKKMNCSPAQLWFRYLIDIGITPLTGTTSTKHMQDDLACLDIKISDDIKNHFKEMIHLNIS